jgi:hypothetical protein
LSDEGSQQVQDDEDYLKNIQIESRKLRQSSNDNQNIDEESNEADDSEFLNSSVVSL